MSSSLSIPDENINFDLVYALHTFVATVDGQASVVKGDTLILADDSNSYWWMVKVMKTSEMGYIPAENIETPFERLARLNKHRNTEITSPQSFPTQPKRPSRRPARRVHLSNKIKFQSQIIGDEDEEWREDYEESEGVLPSAEEDTNDKNTNPNSPNPISNKSNTSVEPSISTPPVDPPEASPTSPTSEDPKRKTSDTLWRLFSRNKTRQNPVILPDIVRETEKQATTCVLRVYAGNLNVGATYNSVLVTKETKAEEMLMQAMERFHISQIEAKASRRLSTSGIEYYLSLKPMDNEEIVLAPQDKPLVIFQSLTAHLTTPMPPLNHIKQLSQHLNGGDFGLNKTVSNQQRARKQLEESQIRFYLHKRIRRVNERQGELYVKISLYTPPSLSQSGLSKKKSAEMGQERIDKIIAIPSSSSVSECTKIALDKFHLAYDRTEGDKGNRYRMTLVLSGKEKVLPDTMSLGDVIRDHASLLTPGQFILRQFGASAPVVPKRKTTPVPILDPDTARMLQKLDSALMAFDESSDVGPSRPWMEVARYGDNDIDIILPHGVLRSTNLPNQQMQYALMAPKGANDFSTILKKVVQPSQPPSRALDTISDIELAALVKYGRAYLDTHERGPVLQQDGANLSSLEDLQNELQRIMAAHAHVNPI
ncbi:hypothetical protein F4703DRAFT_1467222 [Phycomyces blakesleeanus]